MKVRYGSSVRDDDYWARSAVTDEIVDLLGRGDSVGLFGLRRIGKTSVLLAVTRMLEVQGRSAAFINLEGAGSLEAFFETVMKELMTIESGKPIVNTIAQAKILPGLLSAYFKRLLGQNTDHKDKPSAGDFSAYIRAIGSLVTDELRRLLPDQRPILVIDELPYLCEHAIKNGVPPTEIEALLALLRAWRGEGMAMLLSGSIGLYGWTRRKGIDSVHLNDLNPVELPPLSEAEAAAFLTALAKGEGLSWWTADTTAALIKSVSALYPSFLQFAVLKLKRHRNGSPDTVATVYADEVAPNHEIPFFRQFDDRIADYGPLRDRAMTTIDRVCRAEAPGMAYAEFRTVLDGTSERERSDLETMLREDGFLVISTSRGVRPASPLVAVWRQTRGLR